MWLAAALRLAALALGLGLLAIPPPAWAGEEEVLHHGSGAEAIRLRADPDRPDAPWRIERAGGACVLRVAALRRCERCRSPDWFSIAFAPADCPGGPAPQALHVLRRPPEAGRRPVRLVTGGQAMDLVVDEARMARMAQRIPDAAPR